MDYIRRFCNRVIVLDHGIVRAEGNVLDTVARYEAFGKGDLSRLHLNRILPPLSV